MRRVVITGQGCISPVGNTVVETWNSILGGKSGIGPITLFDASLFATRIAGEVKNFKPENHFPVKEIKKMDRFIQLCLVATDEAVRSAELDFAKLDVERVGANIGVGIGGLCAIQNNHREFLERGPRRISPFFIPMAISNLAPGQISIKYGIKGPNLTVTSACSSGAHAIGESMRMIQRGDVDVMIAGGAEAAICETGMGGFCSMRALSEQNEFPEKASRPFDNARDGFVMGEGSAVLILEELEHAKKRGAKILAEIIGYGSNSDGFHMTQPSPEGEGAQRCMRLALKDAGIDVTEVDYVNAHGTSTPVGDVLEVTAIKKVFGDHAYKLSMSSTKSSTGHLLGAAGAIEAVFSILAMRDQVAPPTLNLDNPSEGCDIDLVPHQPKSRKIKTVLSNSYGFGGTNACLVFRDFTG